MGKKCRIEYLPVAQNDLTEILEYIQKDNPSAALNFLVQIDEAVIKLEDFPLMGQVSKDRRLQALNYRMLIVSSYLIIYVVMDNVVEIRRILHGRRKYGFLIDPR